MAFKNHYRGTDADDRLRGRAQADEILGLAGDDELAGRRGGDWIDGGLGNDVLVGGLGNDMLIGGDGIDAVSYARTGGEVHVDLSMGYARDFSDRAGHAYGTDTLSGIEVVIGSRYDDSFIGSDHADDLRGGAGNDYITAGGGDDVVRGDAGDDVLDGGDGFDYADYFYTDGVVVDLRAVLSARTSDGTDQLRHIEGVIGSRSADVLTGNAIANHLSGQAGSDVLSGMQGDDDLEGGRGRDMLTGGAGADRMWGGGGTDRFVFDEGDLGTTRATADWIGDFSPSDGDRLDLRMLDADVSTRRNDAFVYVGAAAFSGAAGEVRYAHVDGETVVELDSNGDGEADGMIRLAGTHELTAGDFLL